MSLDLERVLRRSARALHDSTLRYAGEVHYVRGLDGQDYEVAITLTRSGQPDFHEIYTEAKNARTP